MRVLFAFLVPVIILSTPGASYSDVDVKPNPRDTKVILDVRDRYRGHSPHSGALVVDSKPKPRPRMDCRVDADLLKYGCRTFRPEDPDEAELSEGDIVRAVRQIGLPSLEVQIQPGISTLVNVATIFYTEPQQFNRSVTLLGFDVDLAATPVRYRWLHGDGTASTTTKPGKPYPSTEVTHHYRQPAEAVNPRVDVTYRVRYRVDGGPWNTIDQTLLASGPTTALEVKEAAPVLTHP